MSKVNPTVKNSSMDSERLAGGMGLRAAKQTDIQTLRRITLANLLWEDCAYVDGKSLAQEIVRLVPLCNPKDVANLALECRLVQKLRHTPLFLVSEMCKYDATRVYVGEILPKIITRADMITDFLAIYWKDGKRPLANKAKRGLAASFHNFDAYQFAKYDRDAKIKLRDVMFLCHPKATDAQEEELFRMIAERSLPIPDTWEVALSAGADKKETWTRLINTRKIGGMAFLRNLRNMKDAHVEFDTIIKGLNELKGTMLLPLDYLKAARMAPEFESYIEAKMMDSYARLPKLPGKTLFIVDVSGSMGDTTSSGTNFTRLDQACAMAMLAANQCESYKLVTTAGCDRTSVGSHLEIEYPKKGFGLAKQIMETRDSVGCGGIFTRQVLEWSKKRFEDTDFDRIIIFSDSQDCDRIDKVPHPFAKHNYICDVSSHTKGVNYHGCWTAEISGWSEHFITYIAALEGIENKFEEE